jgi:hypothetical protein
VVLLHGLDGDVGQIEVALLDPEWPLDERRRCVVGEDADDDVVVEVDEAVAAGSGLGDRSGQDVSAALVVGPGCPARR